MSHLCEVLALWDELFVQLIDGGHFAVQDVLDQLIVPFGARSDNGAADYGFELGDEFAASDVHTEENRVG